jgi:hypothetical protein
MKFSLPAGFEISIALGAKSYVSSIQIWALIQVISKARPRLKRLFVVPIVKMNTDLVSSLEY